MMPATGAAGRQTQVATQCHWHAVVKLWGQHNHQPPQAQAAIEAARAIAMQIVLAYSPGPVWHSSLAVALISGS